MGRLDSSDATTVRISHVIDQLDDTIREIRGTIFSLHQTPGVGSGAGDHVDAAAPLILAFAEVLATLAFEPELAIHGPWTPSRRPRATSWSRPSARRSPT